MGHRLYSSREATLDPTGPFGEGAQRSIVIYPDKRKAPPATPEWVEITGRTGSCAAAHDAVAAMRAQEPGTIIMVSGYCHTSLATYVGVRRVKRLQGGPVLRLTEAEVPSGLRPLTEAPAGLPLMGDLLAAARGVVAAIANRDSAAFLRLTQPELALAARRMTGRAVPDWLREELSEVKASFADREINLIFRPLHPVERRQERVFVERQELEDEPEFGDTGPQELLVCWCRLPSCDGRWPIVAYDADNHRSRPYACVRTNTYLLGRRDGSAIQANVEIGPRGFAEPDWRTRTP